MDTKSELLSIRQSHEPVARRLPIDVLYELYPIVAALDPPIRKKHVTGSFWRTLSRPADSPRERLGPTWSSPPVQPGVHEKIASLSTYRFWDDPPTLGWIRLTHVCKQWRAVGLCMAHLWGDVFPIFPLAAETILARSCGLPLSLDMDLVGAIEYPRVRRPDHIVAFFRLARQNIPRARVLTFAHYHNHFMDWDVTRLLGLKMPFLEKLRIDSDGRARIDRHGPPIQAPSLTHAVLGVYLPFSAPALRFLQFYNLDTILRPDFLFDLLRTTPLLEELVVGRVVQEEGLDAMPNLDKIPVLLPKLTVARFSGPPSSLAFAGHLRVPANAELTFHIESSPSPQNGTIQPLLDALTPHLQNPSIDSVSFNPSYRDVEVCLATTSPDDTGSARLFFLKVDYMTTVHDQTLHGPLDFLSQVVRRMSVTNIASFHVYSFLARDQHTHMDPALLETQAASVLQQLPVIQNLSLAWMPARYQPFLPAWAVNVADNIENLVVYSDDTLVAYDVSSPWGGDRIVVTAAQGVQSRWKELVSALERRTNLGRPLKRLVLKGLLSDTADSEVIPSSMIPAVSALVVEVVDDRRCP